jgi:hypothetical protein
VDIAIYGSSHKVHHRLPACVVGGADCFFYSSHFHLGRILKGSDLMLARMIQFQFILCVLIVFIPMALIHAQSNYPEAIGVLQTAYQNEIQAHFAYLAYAEKAVSENYPNIAHLFNSLASSEAIHARNPH